MAEIREEIVTRLVGTRKFGSIEAARLGERAGWKCEYCGLNILATLENYKLWQTDHIIPKCKGGLEDFDNLALSCLHCNWHFKRDFDPRPAPGLPPLSRKELIDAVKIHIEKTRKFPEADLELFREIIGHRLSSGQTA